MMQKAYVSLMTAFDSNGFVDEKGTREIVRHAIDEMKADGLFVNGNIGENFLLGTPAKKNILRMVWEEAKDDQVDLIAQIGSPNFHEGKDMLNYVTYTLGYKTVAAITPFYYHFTFSEIKNYYDQLVKDIDTQMIIYVAPAMTGVNLTLNQYRELFSNPKIIGVDLECSDLKLLERLRRNFPDKKIYFGCDELLLPALSLGADGCIESSLNVNGKRIRQEILAYDNKNMVQALKLQNETNDLLSELERNGLYQMLKIVLQLMGVHAGYNRIPLSKPNNSQKAVAQQILAKYF